MAQQSLDEAVIQQLDDKCTELRQGFASDPIPGFGDQLGEICSLGGGVTQGSGVSASGTAQTTQGLGLSLDRLVELRQEQDSDRGVRVAAVGTGDATVSVAGDTFPSGLGFFLSPSYERLDRAGDDFETGYDSKIVGITGGADYRFAKGLVAGVALNYGRWTGDFDGGGDFAVTSYGPIVYASAIFAPDLFAQASAGFSFKEYDHRRLASWGTSEFGAEQVLSSGAASASYDGDEFSTQVLAGYDYRFDRFAIGPRMGMSYVHNSRDGYAESGRFLAGALGDATESPDLFNAGTPTGLELAVQADSRTSLQSMLGLQASALFRLGGAIVRPQVMAAWRHEFSDDRRSIVARFDQDERAEPQLLTFQTASPDRNFFDIGAAVSIEFENGVQPFLAARSMVGNRNFDSSSVVFGVRFTFD